jgi:hypothetical protein
MPAGCGPIDPGGWLTRTSANPHRLTYTQAEEAVFALAAELIGELGGGEARQFCYSPIPRGGLIVLGMLAYALDLDRGRLQRRPPGAPLVVVDDCSLSGARFGRFLQSVDSPQVLFAHLFSHPDLRAAILAQEQRVVGCVAAGDLRDLAPEVYPDRADYQAWQARWRQRLEGPRYWIGLPELVIFPWSEPDRPYWNPLTEQAENNWRFAPPDRCLKNWGRLNLPPRAVEHPMWRSPDHIAYSLEDEQVTLCNLQSKQLYGLEGIAADMWRALVAYRSTEAVVQYILSRYDVDEATLRHDLGAFVESLLAAGLLESVGKLESI